MDNSLKEVVASDLENERAAVALLLAAAKEAMDAAPAPAEPELEPAGDITDLSALFEKQKQIGNQLAALKSREADLTRQLQSLRDEAAELESQAEAVKARAAILFETLFGKPEHPVPRPQIPAPSQIAKPEVSIKNVSPQAPSSYTTIPSLSL